MIRLFKHVVKILLFVLALGFTPLACKDGWESSVPWVEVVIDIQLANYIDLNIPGNYIYFPQQGYAGVILMCTGEGTYAAYDAACTYDISNKCSLLETGAISGVIGTCPCCGSKFNLLSDGYPISGSAAEPLKQYRVYLLNNGMRIRVTN